jgi:nucleoid-associated protein YgaU
MMQRYAGRRLARGIVLVAALAAAGLAVRAAAGDPVTQLAVIADVGNPTADPVDAVVASLAMLAEALAAYLLLVAALGTATSLPGILGDLAKAALRLVSTARLQKAVEAVLGGVMLANATLAPGMQGGFAVTRPAPPPASTGSTRSTAVVSPEATSSEVVAAGVLNVVRGAALGRASTSTVPGSPGVAPLGPAGPAVGPGPSRSGKRPEGRAPDPAHGRRAGVARVVHVVARGDTLWEIAERHLPAPRRQPSEIARYWPRIYAANRGVIGTDPDRLLPGMRLSIPAVRNGPVGDDRAPG